MEKEEKKRFLFKLSDKTFMRLKKKKNREEVWWKKIVTISSVNK